MKAFFLAQGRLNASDRCPRSADFQSAVSQGFQPAGATTCNGTGQYPRHGRPGRSADWKSAIQQIGNLRYGLGALTDLVHYTLLVFLAVVPFIAAQAAAPVAQKPDILLLMPDQMRGDCLSLLGHPAVRTPHMDKLAQEGALFRRAYSTCPSCIPARVALLTGLFPATSGVVGYAARPFAYPTLPGTLATAGYQTLLVGRYMHQKPDDEHYGYQKEIRGSTYVSNDDYDQWLRQVAPETGGIRALVAKLGVSNNGWQAKPWPLAPELHPTAWTVRQARNTLTELPLEKPLFLTTSFYSPHPPLFPPTNYFNAYLAQKLPAPAHGDWVDWAALSPEGDKPGHRVLLQGDTLRATQAGYFGLIQQLDDQIVPLIAEFKARSQKAKRPWVILLTADHGEMLGDHGFFRKCEPFEGADNIPLLIAASPELGFKAGVRSTQPVCLEDIMPTLLELAGAKCPKPMDGVSLLPTLRGEKQVIREWLHTEHSPCYGKAQAFHALTDGHTKYIWRPQDGTEYLFDLDQDPREEHDLTKVEAQKGKLEQCRQRLVKELAGRPEGFTDGKTLIAGRPYPALQKRDGVESKAETKSE
jgi:arylsulfatase